MKYSSVPSPFTRAILRICLRLKNTHAREFGLILFHRSKLNIILLIMPANGYRCVSINCNNYSGDTAYSFHRFPTNKERLVTFRCIN